MEEQHENTQIISPVSHHHLQNFSNFFSNAQYMIPYPMHPWHNSPVPPMIPAFHSAGGSSFEGSNGQLNSIQQVLPSETQSVHGISPEFVNYSYLLAIKNKQIIKLHSCTLYPPAPNTEIKRNDKPPGCRTVYIGGLPDSITEDIIREVFSLCGKIETVRMNTRKFCYVRFSCQEEIETALCLSKYVMKIENKDEASHSKQLHVDYAESKADQHEEECARRLAIRIARHKVQEEQEALERNRPRVVPFSEIELQNILSQFKNSNFKDGIHTLNTWLDKGEVKKRNSGTFYMGIQILYNNIRKLLSEKVKQEERSKEAKLEHRQMLQNHILQLKRFGELFHLAAQHNNWNHFSKSKRIDIGLWKKQILEVKRANEEESVEERIEDEMELSDEKNSTSEDFSKQAEILQMQINDAKSGIASLEESITSLRSEKDNALEASSRRLNLSKSNLKLLRDEYEKLKALGKKMTTVKTGRNLSTEPMSTNSVEISPKDAHMLSLICHFLIVHPFPENVNYICSYLNKIFSPESSSHVANLMRRFPEVFEETMDVGATLESKWALKKF